jgi:predicted DsbA family dithiol-disulfide isomerase
MTLKVDVWSDLACPWCYVGKRHLEQALERFEHAGEVEVTFRSFELDPGAPPAPKDPTETHAQKLARKYGMSVAEAQARLDSMTRMGEGKGITFDFAKVISTNTFDAHRLLWLAKSQGKGLAVTERLMRAYFSEGRALGEREVLVQLAAEAGLEPAQARAALESGAFEREVRGDEAQAQEYGISGVPFFVLGRYGVSGAQPPEVLLKALATAWAEQGAAGPGAQE